MTKCTDLARTIDATALHVCCAGDRAALHFASPAGATVVRLPLAEFLTKCRGLRDSNGNPFPSAKPTRAEQLAADAAALPPPAAKPVRKRRRGAGKKLDPARRALYLAAYCDKCREPAATWRDISNRHGVPHEAWELWCRKHRAECDAHYDALGVRAPIPKPNGRLL